MLEIALHFDSFRNIQLMEQGLYKLRISLKDHKRFAVPYKYASKPVTSDYDLIGTVDPAWVKAAESD